jgi:hypothetical protein
VEDSRAIAVSAGATPRSWLPQSGLYAVSLVRSDEGGVESVADRRRDSPTAPGGRRELTVLTTSHGGTLAACWECLVGGDGARDVICTI